MMYNPLLDPNLEQIAREEMLGEIYNTMASIHALSEELRTNPEGALERLKEIRDSEAVYPAGRFRAGYAIFYHQKLSQENYRCSKSS